MSVRDIIAEAIRDEPHIDHGEPPSAEQYADAVINELHCHGYIIVRTTTPPPCTQFASTSPTTHQEDRVTIDYWRLRDIAAATHRDLGDNEYEAIHGALAELLDMLDAARACALRARLIHEEDPATGNCLGCNTVGYCEDSVPWPCPTIRALHGIT